MNSLISLSDGELSKRPGAQFSSGYIIKNALQAFYEEFSQVQMSDAIVIVATYKRSH